MRRARQDGALVMVGWCVEHGEQVMPLAPLADVLRELSLRLDVRR